MNEYQTFIFEEIVWNAHARKILLRYSMDHSVIFDEMLFLPDEPLTEHFKERKPLIDQALFALHLIGGISYYKTYCPREIRIKSGSINKKEAQFWETVYTQGLGEFFFKNQIDFRGLIRFPALEPKARVRNVITKKFKPDAPKRILVPIGGGKDSLVTIELLKKSGAQLTLLRVGEHPFITELAHKTGLPMLTVKRGLSPTLFELNAKGVLNGHVPITAYLSVLSMLLALLYDYDAVALSNEWSASEGSIEYLGTDVNHQWSKSLQFEKMLRGYLQNTMGIDIEYFSMLRPMSELKIAEVFAQMPQFHSAATSCNANWTILKDKPTERWCRKCPKCAFVYALMAAFLPKKKCVDMFGGDLFEDVELIPLYKSLLGIEAFKPFECVGTPEETKAAFLLARTFRKKDASPIMRMFEKEVLPSIKNEKKLIEDALALRKDHCIPPSLSSLLPA